jgi:hypothetical protein
VVRIGGHVAAFNKTQKDQPTEVRLPGCGESPHIIRLETWLGQSPFNSAQSVTLVRGAAFIPKKRGLLPLNLIIWCGFLVRQAISYFYDRIENLL